ncbi:3567_t:CDS:2 [Funneliformis caledonium]|uniref:3567_t:CDS:1 n=1 Tax=Funneliformis caledonium TaxID=1117310 RepID=A0A9N9GZU6_9GLOM|nr:3567_t:CDS:2 [Funneliformis caledonium]
MVKQPTEKMDETTIEGLSKAVQELTVRTCGQENHVWKFRDDPNYYSMGRNLSPVRLLCQTPNQEGESRESDGVSHTKVGVSARMDQEERNEKKVPSERNKCNIFGTEQDHVRSVSKIITNFAKIGAQNETRSCEIAQKEEKETESCETARNNKIRTIYNAKESSKDKVRRIEDTSIDESHEFCSNRGRIRGMESSIGKLFRIYPVGGVARRTKETCKLIQPHYQCDQDGNAKPVHQLSESILFDETPRCRNNTPMVVEMFASESNRQHVADTVYPRPCKVSNLTDCMNVKSALYEYVNDVRDFGFDHIILIGERDFGMIFFDCYGRIFELYTMDDALWPLRNPLEETATKPWTDNEVAWTVDEEDGTVFEHGMYASIDYFVP